MIAKKIINPKKTSPKHVRISRLAAYIRAPERTDTTEKCTYAAARGFHARTPAGQTCEMIALAEDAVRSRDPVTHYVLSWPTGERPTPDQVEAAVTILLDEMAIPDHQAIYGLHADTAHHHLHVLVNRAHPVPRIHPVTGELETRVVKINRGFDIEAAHRAGARIEHAQGWRVEANKRYRIAGTDGVGKPVLERTDPEASHRRRKPSQQQIDAELRTGAPSIARRVIDLVAPILAAAAGWPDWHARLDAQGIRYARRGSGAVFILDGIAIKASRVDRKATLRALEQRFGPYQAREPARTPAPLPSDLAPFFTKLLAEIESTGASSAEEKWRRWHAGVAAGGYGYRKQGSGAVIDTGHGVFKASDVSRRITRAALEKSFGPYRAPANTVAAAPPAATPEPEIADPPAAAPRLAALLAEVDSTRDGEMETVARRHGCARRELPAARLRRGHHLWRDHRPGHGRAARPQPWRDAKALRPLRAPARPGAGASSRASGSAGARRVPAGPRCAPARARWRLDRVRDTVRARSQGPQAKTGRQTPGAPGCPPLGMARPRPGRGMEHPCRPPCGATG